MKWIFNNRFRVASLYVMSLAAAVVLTALLSGDPDDLLFHPSCIVWFPHGIALLFPLANSSGLFAPLYWCTVAVYAGTSVTGTVLKNKWVYLVFALVLCANVGGCTKMYAEERARKKEKKTRQVEQPAAQVQSEGAPSD